ncbi:hypothetical protein CBS147320_6340 [Aspergillus niger]|nr:hypothetical protein CBS147371_1963 [Aspergillus niger]KAI2925323.1 hypothetical protein CBS147320_6340 [Aspergillus niger]KAI2988284.1 hypothetical protein CBS147344_4063 [Aspergillus niger]KAI3029585.1 hypothetical protein CBS147482_111 [Aspergillus niger]KAI3060128.1 hypothetical protein CBS147352_487 [Aspergillus niger]
MAINALSIAISLLVIYPISRIVYNVFFSPLSHLPGPISWSATRLPFTRALLRGTIVHDFERLHRKYGPVVRTAPDEVSFASGDAWTDIYASRPDDRQFLKDPLWWRRQPGQPDTLLSAIHPAKHSRMRKLLAPAFTPRALRVQEAVIQRYASLLVDRIKDQVSVAGTDGAVIDMGPWFNFTTFDIFGDLGFGESFNCLQHSQYHPWIALLFGSVKAASFIAAARYYPPLETLLMKCIPRSLHEKSQRHYRQIIDKIDRRLSWELQRPDIMSHLMDENGQVALPRGELNSTFMILTTTGSETTATVLTGILTYLVNQPEVLGRLIGEIRGRFESSQDISLSVAADLPYLTAVIQEGLRLCPPVPWMLPRQVPPGGSTVCGTWLPGGTAVSLQAYTLNRDTSRFHAASSFLPERWLPDASSNPNSNFYQDDRHAVQPFSMGPRSCLGQHLAWAEMRLILTKLLVNFDFEAVEGKQLRWEELRTFLLVEKRPLENFGQQNLTPYGFEQPTLQQITFLSEDQINEVTQPEDIICVISDGTIEWLLAMLAVIQSGCTYCPVDVNLPRARQQYIIESVSAKVVLVPQSNMRTAFGFLEDIKVWDVGSLITHTAVQRNPVYRDVQENNIAVIIFTSGSKGVPKAVQLVHKSIMSLLSVPEGRLYSKPGWRIAQTLSLGFDCCVLEVLSATCFGATLVLKDFDDPLAHLNRVDAMVATPSLLATLEPKNYRNLRRTRKSALAGLRRGRESTSLTKSNGLYQVGVKGEIYISGVQVTPGYRNNAAQTASTFLPDLLVGGPQKRFKTGDMGRLMRDGYIEYIGREDDLFKIRGFRVDLGDIEASILALAPEVDNIAVIVAPSADLLIAFATPMSVNIPILHEKIKNNIPARMVPTHILALPDLPLSPNHKVDRRKLASMEISLARATVPLTTPTERLIAEVWRELLGQSPITEQIGASDHFLEMGGHSLLQIRVAQPLSQALNISFPLRLVIQYPILRELSQAIEMEVLARKECNSRSSFRSFKSVSRTGDLPVSFLEEELLINDLLSASSRR